MSRLRIVDLLQGRTLEETVDHALRAVVKQGKLSKNDVTGQCYYRHPDDNNVRCAIGHMIPDSMYDELMEGSTAYGLTYHNEDTRIRHFLCTVQAFHDDGPHRDVDIMLERAISTDNPLHREYPWLSTLAQRIIDDKASGRL